LASEKEAFLAKLGTEGKGHGRIELRKYEFYDGLMRANWRKSLKKTKTAAGSEECLVEEGN
jgi:hypothetical protein